MKKCLSLLLVTGLAVSFAGCAKKPDPTKAPGFVDTASDPMKVMETMKTPGQAPGQGGAAPAGGGAGMGAGAGAPPAGS